MVNCQLLIINGEEWAVFLVVNSIRNKELSK